MYQGVPHQCYKVYNQGSRRSHSHLISCVCIHAGCVKPPKGAASGNIISVQSNVLVAVKHSVVNVTLVLPNSISNVLL